jgi:hypothetical protein
MRLFTIAASIVSLVGAIAIGDVILQMEVRHADWCGEIASKQWVANNIFNDWNPLLDQKLAECDEAQSDADSYDRGHGTFAGTAGTGLAERWHNLFARLFGQSEVASSVPPKSLASTP